MGKLTFFFSFSNRFSTNITTCLVLCFVLFLPGQPEKLVDIFNFLRICDVFGETDATKVKSLRVEQVDFFSLQQFTG